MKPRRLSALVLAASTLLACGKETTAPQTEPINFEGRIFYVSAIQDPSEYPNLPSVIESITSNGGIEDLTGNSGNNSQPKVSPDGSMIAARSGHIAHPGIFIYSSEDGTIKELFEGDNVAYEWSPDNRALVVSQTDKSNRGTIYLAPLSGNAVALTDSASSNLEASYSPDGNKIIFASNRDNKDEFSIYTMNVDGSNPVRITGGRNPKYSPNGQRIAFIFPSYPGFTSGGVQVFNPQDGHVDSFGTFVKDFSWDPTSSKIAFASRDYLNIWEADLNTGGVKELTPRDSDSIDPAYSPDGKRLVFSMAANGNTDLYIVPSGGGLVQRLTESPKMELLPQWK